MSAGQAGQDHEVRPRSRSEPRSNRNQWGVRYDEIGRVPAAAFAVGFAVVIVRDASEVTERTSSASLCKRWSRSASRAAIRRCSACSSDSASAFRFLRPGSWMAQRFREVGRKSFCDGTCEASVPNRLVGTPFSHPRIGCRLSDDASATILCGCSRACRPPDRRPTPSCD